MAMVVTRVLLDTRDMRQLELRTRLRPLAFSARRSQFSPNSCPTLLTRRIEFAGQNVSFRSLIRKGQCDMATGLPISLPLQKRNCTLHILRRLLLQQTASTG